MKLEEEIKQSKGFKNEVQKLIVNIYYRNSIITNRLQDSLKVYDITHQQYNILRILRGQHPEAISINVLKERMLDRNSDVSRLITRLCTKELVGRCICEDDRRQMDIVISNKGLKLLESLDSKVDDLESTIKGLTDQEVKQLNDLLDKIE